MALIWIKTNIAAFGGNPNAVTIMGESAGATSICLHMISPASFALYSQAIIESNPCYFMTTSLDVVHQQAVMVQNYLNCAGSMTQISSCLRSISAANLQTASNKINFIPNAAVDGMEIPTHPYLAISSGYVNPVPLISGNVLNEGTIFDKTPRPVSLQTYKQFLIQQFNVMNPLVLEQYPCNTTDCWSVMAQVIGDFYIVCPTLQIANALLPYSVNNFAYLFTHVPSWSIPVIPNRGAFHSSEIPFVFSTLALAYSTTQAETYLSNQMTQLWTNFGSTGNPNLPRNISQLWPPYTASNGTRIVLDTTLSTTSAWKKIECQFWDTIYRLLYTTK
jgi:carboxylesterase type B